MTPPTPTTRRTTLRAAWVRARLLATCAGEPDSVAMHMGAPPRWRALFGRAVARFYRAALTKQAASESNP
jgi:hypothetical protein